MASQEFLASFAVDIDEAGVSRLRLHPPDLPEHRRVPLHAGGRRVLAAA